MGSGGTDSAGDGGGRVDLFSASLKDRILYAGLAIALGIGTGSLLQDSRPDPWTGTMDAQRMMDFEAEIKEYIELRVRHFEDHAKDAVDWKLRIRELEKNCSLTSERVNEMRSGRGNTGNQP